ncbi:hypothetical protein DFH08DRAFT_824995 [Mycena albidolilacea]|uniref:Uncharacterized protein n=1 Tax=Mycena albidolilacea TaxID=1033008 RepID=A0AAD6Z2R6_9AGAR|nr:hypothetical protein DFH08DRAFT_824995 [Mycena albidolilacea]
MAPTNIMIAGGTTGQGVGEWVGNLLWWGGLFAGMAALCVILVWATQEERVALPSGGYRRVPRLLDPRLSAVGRKGEGVLAPQEGGTGPGEKALREWGNRIETWEYQFTPTGELAQPRRSRNRPAPTPGTPGPLGRIVDDEAGCTPPYEERPGSNPRTRTTNTVPICRGATVTVTESPLRCLGHGNGGAGCLKKS